jgi:hypothetical protein
MTLLVQSSSATTMTTSSWPEIIADLDSLTETEIEQDGKRFIVRSTPRRQLRYPCDRHRAAAHRARGLSLISGTEM